MFSLADSSLCFNAFISFSDFSQDCAAQKDSNVLDSFTYEYSEVKPFSMDLDVNSSRSSLVSQVKIIVAYYFHI